MGLSEREKMDKWHLDERILSKDDLTIWLKYEDDTVVDFRWKTKTDIEFKHSPECVQFFHNNTEKLYGCDVAKIETAIDFYNQFKS
tara:strand:- start:8251 stop:8508 length:258 start_codon:yes stop_codon:yes gene_type:complete